MARAWGILRIKPAITFATIHICRNDSLRQVARLRATRRVAVFCRPTADLLLMSSARLLSMDPQALAVIDGTLCQLTRDGNRAGGHAPLATAVVEFRRGSMRYYVREHPFGLLPGLPNLYCLDAGFRLQWMAQWPDATDPCASIIGEEGETLVALSTSGTVVRLQASTGRLLGVELPMAAAI